MRILCCLNRDLASNVALNLLLPALASHEVRVGLTERVGAAPAAEHADRRELRIAEQTIPNELFFPLIERAALPDNGARFLTFAEIDRCRGIPVAPLQNPNTASGLRQVQDFAPDLIVTIRYGAILKSALIAIPKRGIQPVRDLGSLRVTAALKCCAATSCRGVSAMQRRFGNRVRRCERRTD